MQIFDAFLQVFSAQPGILKRPPLQSVKVNTVLGEKGGNRTIVYNITCPTAH
jgi:hypothetical protein